MSAFTAGIVPVGFGVKVATSPAVCREVNSAGLRAGRVTSELLMRLAVETDRRVETLEERVGRFTKT